MTIRVRFAPSPTGLLHIGNARAALINWLFAKKNNGQFLLRIDDTDLERSKPEYEQAILKDMEWLGLAHDETFKQSDFFDRYHAARQLLIDKGRLYPCYETKEELDFKRKRLLASGKPPIYDRAALKLTEQEIQAFEKEGRKPHWRFKLEPGEIRWNDMVRGPVSFQAELLSDPVLIRADGAFLYTITSVADDLASKMTHIIRGEDHVSNTATQVQLFKALNHDTPYDVTFGHTTLLMDHNGGALSKRLGSLSLSQMRENGIEPMAINSLLARLGTSLPIEPRLNMAELIEAFDLSTFSRTPPRYSDDELIQLNHKLFQNMPFEDVSIRLHAKGVTKIQADHWELLKNNIHTLDELKKWEEIFYRDDFLGKAGSDRAFYETALQTLPKEWSENTWKTWTDAIKQETGTKGKQLFMPLRNALTGDDHGPEMRVLVLQLGRDRVYKIIEKLISQF